MISPVILIVSGDDALVQRLASLMDIRFPMSPCQVTTSLRAMPMPFAYSLAGHRIVGSYYRSGGGVGWALTGLYYRISFGQGGMMREMISSVGHRWHRGWYCCWFREWACGRAEEMVSGRRLLL